jgi:hypothetical protein
LPSSPSAGITGMTAMPGLIICWDIIHISKNSPF